MTTPLISHPYAMYTAIHAQPREVQRVSRSRRDQLQKLLSKVRVSDLTTFIGIGSSLHAAQIGAALWREALPGKRVSSAHSFDLAIDPGPIVTDGARHTVICFSHRGTKRYSLRALALAKELGAYTCLITGENVDIPLEVSDIHITTVPQEISSAHTVSVLGSIALITTLIELLTKDARATLISQLQEAISHALTQERLIQEIANRISPRVRNIWLVGAGSDVYVAKEIALKIKETSYIPAEGMSVEEMLHGPFQCVEPEDTIVALNTQESAPERFNALLAMSNVIGVPVITLSSIDGPYLDNSIGGITVKTGKTKTIRSVCSLVALQLLTYFLATARGKNPDSFRLDDRRFKEALSLVSL
jgi:glucosamine--fructose-6-phosphate aminotransferase (isomerizing)